MAVAVGPGLGVEELSLLEKSLGLKKGNKYSSQGERKIPVLQTNNGPSLTGLTTIAMHLVKQAKQDQLLGSTAEEKAIVQQWLEYRVTQVDNQSSKEESRIILKDLNSYLEDKVYVTGNNFTLADILMYYGLHHIIADLTVQEKEKYLNVSRWFNHIQHYPDVGEIYSRLLDHRPVIQGEIRYFIKEFEEKRGFREVRVLENLKNTVFEANDQTLPKCEQVMHDSLNEALRRLQAGNNMINRLQQRDQEGKQLQKVESRQDWTV
ncbi:eukaryotic translation elongation factor 1 epsilon-1-like isoform X2 [Eublepharis macularius]|uniref:Biogenesis of lysosome-related organelles complex 1 subunit 5 n=1 Tax=Eublepharis macularius TaxID=481883 RepID=A0AA97JKT2_EUBMA|nr:eukaryotic translation elongation factor 1 epsilon-1-like isoform X2 [Eublepharis macularius]